MKSHRGIRALSRATESLQHSRNVLAAILRLQHESLVQQGEFIAELGRYVSEETTWAKETFPGGETSLTACEKWTSGWLRGVQCSTDKMASATESIRRRVESWNPVEVGKGGRS